MKKTFLTLLSLLLGCDSYAFYPAITQSNNQIFLNGNFFYENLNYSGNRPADAGVPIFNAKVKGEGGTFGVTRTFGVYYTQLTLDAKSGNVEYNDSKLSSTSLSDGNLFTLTMEGQFGHSFYMPTYFALTPYLLAGYYNQQLITGGFPANYFYNGATLVIQSLYYGIGLLGQWALAPYWVLGADAAIGRQLNPTISGNVNNFNNQPTAATTYQRWHPRPAQLWHVGLTSDYIAPYQIHIRASVAYGHEDLGKASSSNSGVFPSQINPYWYWTLGLGVSTPPCDFFMFEPFNGQAAIHAANNQSRIHLGYVWQKISDATPFFDANINPSMPYVAIAFNKTFDALYFQLSAKEGFEITTQHKSQDTIYDLSTRLGFLMPMNTTMSLTPYGTVGYHRSLLTIQGTVSNEINFNGIDHIYYINGITQTLQHGWYGLGLLWQWAATPGWVLYADANVGRIFGATARSWSPLNLPIYTSFNLQNNWYEMVAVGGDYNLGRHWHIGTNIQFWNYQYHSDEINAPAISNLNVANRQFGFDLYFGYSFG